MKTIQDIKNQYAQEQGYEDWDELMRLNILTVNARKEYEVENHYTEICLRAQKAALEKNIGRMKSLRSVYDVGSGQHNILSLLIVEFENPENLIR